ncbi:MAG TPA: pyridoxal 5'-phosphate synthase glutaminase subunit PdxT, partial [Pseudolysinimonas sp.]|nr:pyridoxal 5'-phosphate synthase glutaminase subunit PdxT [Pseudolysinimonas sp.]
MAGNSSKPRVGVLALQGDFREHLLVLRELGADAVPVRRESELDTVAGLVIPGGESSVMDKLSRTFGLAEPLKGRIAAGMPVYGTCAGLIMLADQVTDAITGQQTLGGFDITVRRNAFGNQNDSFETDLEIPELGEPPVHAVFIRAPAVEAVGADATTLAELDDGRVVAVEQGNLLGTAFH